MDGEAGSDALLALWRLRLVPDGDLCFDGHQGFAWHGAFFGMIKRLDRALAARLHRGSSTRAFRLSFPQRRLYERGKPIDLLIGSADPELNRAIDSLRVCTQGDGFRMGLEHVEMDLLSVELLKSASMEYVERFRLPASFAVQFRSATCFRSQGKHLLFPDPHTLFGSLLGRWNSLFNVQMTLYDEELDRVAVNGYRLHTRTLKMERFELIGFVGYVSYVSRGLKVESRSKLGNLLLLADYLGVGYHTTMGLGNCRVVFGADRGGRGGEAV